MTQMGDEWNIDSISLSLTRRSTKQEQLKTKLMEAMHHQMEHEMTFKTRERVSRFIRSTKQSDIIGHNYMIMRSLQIAAENCKKNQIFNFSLNLPLLVTRSRSGLDMFQETCQRLNNELLSVSECEAVDCNATSPYRTISGCCNNIANKTLGSTHRAFNRLMKNQYEDLISLPRGGMNPSNLPSPRDISSAVHRVKETKPKPPVSVMLMQFGQFIDHDMTLTPEQG
jgi:hypothetical protein